MLVKKENNRGFCSRYVLFLFICQADWSQRLFAGSRVPRFIPRSGKQEKKQSREKEKERRKKRTSTLSRLKEPSVEE